MQKNARIIVLTVALSVFGLMYISGCSSSLPSQDEMNQLQTVRSEIQSLEQKKIDLEKEQSMLSTDIADKESTLKSMSDKQNELKNEIH